jgi:hypothetical protein
MKYHNVFTLKVGSLHASLFVATRLQRAHGLKMFAVYIHYRQRVRVQWPRRQNMAKPYGADLPAAEILRTWSGLTVADRGCDPNYKPTKDWDQIAKELPNSQYAQEQAQNLREWRTRQKASPN